MDPEDYGRQLKQANSSFGLSMFSLTLQNNGIAGLYLKSPCHFACKFLAHVSQTFLPQSYDCSC